MAVVTAALLVLLNATAAECHQAMSAAAPAHMIAALDAVPQHIARCEPAGQPSPGCCTSTAEHSTEPGTDGPGAPTHLSASPGSAVPPAADGPPAALPPPRPGGGRTTLTGICVSRT